MHVFKIGLLYLAYVPYVKCNLLVGTEILQNKNE